MYRTDRTHDYACQKQKYLHSLTHPFYLCTPLADGLVLNGLVMCQHSLDQTPHAFDCNIEISLNYIAGQIVRPIKSIHLSVIERIV